MLFLRPPAGGLKDNKQAFQCLIHKIGHSSSLGCHCEKEYLFLSLNKLDSMTKENAIKLFQDHRVRVQWSDEQEKWFFSIVDIVKILTDSPNPRKYWSVLKTRLKKEGSELTTNCSQLKFQRKRSLKHSLKIE